MQGVSETRGAGGIRRVVRRFAIDCYPPHQPFQETKAAFDPDSWGGVNSNGYLTIIDSMGDVTECGSSFVGVFIPGPDFVLLPARVIVELIEMHDAPHAQSGTHESQYRLC